MVGKKIITDGEELFSQELGLYQSALSIGALATNYRRSKKKTVERKKEAWSCPPDYTIKINVEDP